MPLIENIDPDSMKVIQLLKSTSLGCKKQRYQEYLRTEYWRQLKEKMRELAKGRCEDCGLHENIVALQLHHQCYDRIGQEEESDLRLICEECHERRR